MAMVPKVTTGAYDGRPFELIQHVVHIEGNEYVRRVEGYLLGFDNGDVKYVLDYDPLLKFDPIRLDEIMVHIGIDMSTKGDFTSSDIIPNAFVGFLGKTEDGKVELAKREIVKVFDINKSMEAGKR